MNKEPEATALKPGKLVKSEIPRRQIFHNLLGAHRLQSTFVALAIIWTISAYFFGGKIINLELNGALRDRQTEMKHNALFRVKIFEQKMHQAEQLSKTLSLNEAYLQLAKDEKRYLPDLRSMTLQQRTQAIAQLKGLEKINQSFRLLASQIDAYQIFMMDHQGYCIASGRSGEKDDCLGLRYHTRQYIQDAVSSGYGRQYAVGRTHPVPSFFFSSALRENGELFGIIVIRLTTPELTGIIDSNTQTLVLLTSGQGVVIASSDPSLMFHHVGSQWSTLPEAELFREIYKRDNMQTLPLRRAPEKQGGISVWLWEDERFIVEHRSVSKNDFSIFIFRNVEDIFAASNHWWGLVALLCAAGLLVILLIERSINFSHHRKSHLLVLSEANRHLSRLSRELYELTVTDSLTGLSSRRFFTRKLEETVKLENVQPSRGVGLLLLDIDNFKSINDSYGHPAGDEAIRSMATISSSCVRSVDIVGRLGGEEFGILLLDMTEDQSKEIAQRILQKCESTVIQFQQYAFSQTCSIGIALYNNGESADQLLSRADKALYQAKNQGRNRYVFNKH